jgi:hypothetical protein
MKLKLWRVDAFATRRFCRGTSHRCAVGSWLPDAIMQAVRTENNLAETAFLRAQQEGSTSALVHANNGVRCAAMRRSPRHGRSLQNWAGLKCVSLRAAC